jgi:3-oxoacyl-[acyl-carrier-protein] synthase II
MKASEKIFVCGIGAVSPAGWGVAPLRDALARGDPAPTTQLPRPGWNHPIRVRQVPPPLPRPAFMSHPRLRRVSPIAHYAAAAALEALGDDAAQFQSRPAAGASRLGIIFCSMCGCVNYSRRFYDEVLRDPATASPLIFPETVFNSTASHLAALLGTLAINYTLVGDPGTFLQGIALAAGWLASERADACLVVGAEEMDWLTADAMRLFQRGTILADGAGALYLRREPGQEPVIHLHAVTSAHLFGENQSRAAAARKARAELSGIEKDNLLCDGLQGIERADRDERSAWRDWRGPRLSLKKILGEGLMASAAWQCAGAVAALKENRCAAATVSVVGCNQQAIAAQFVSVPG